MASTAAPLPLDAGTVAVTATEKERGDKGDDNNNDDITRQEQEQQQDNRNNVVEELEQQQDNQNNVVDGDDVAVSRQEPPQHNDENNKDNEIKNNRINGNYNPKTGPDSTCFLLKTGIVIRGHVCRVEPYGVFVEWPAAITMDSNNHEHDEDGDKKEPIVLLVRGLIHVSELGQQPQRQHRVDPNHWQFHQPIYARIVQITPQQQQEQQRRGLPKISLSLVGLNPQTGDEILPSSSSTMSQHHQNDADHPVRSSSLRPPLLHEQERYRYSRGSGGHTMRTMMKQRAEERAKLCNSILVRNGHGTEPQTTALWMPLLSSFHKDDTNNNHSPPKIQQELMRLLYSASPVPNGKDTFIEKEEQDSIKRNRTSRSRHDGDDEDDDSSSKSSSSTSSSSSFDRRRGRQRRSRSRSKSRHPKRAREDERRRRTQRGQRGRRYSTSSSSSSPSSSNSSTSSSSSSSEVSYKQERKRKRSTSSLSLPQQGSPENKDTNTSTTENGRESNVTVASNQQLPPGPDNGNVHVDDGDDDDDGSVGPQPPSREKVGEGGRDLARQAAAGGGTAKPGEYGKALLPGEGAAMAQFVQQNLRVPRRGEIGYAADEIERYEQSGYVMSGSRHARMNAVRIRKENQVYSAEEQRALHLLQLQENQAKEAVLVQDWKNMLLMQKQQQQKQQQQHQQLAGNQSGGEDKGGNH